MICTIGPRVTDARVVMMMSKIIDDKSYSLSFKACDQHIHYDLCRKIGIIVSVIAK